MTEDRAQPALQGPYSYENWRAMLAGQPSLGASEYQLFTDAHITGEIREGCGPYLLLNTVPMISAAILMPAVILRMEHHLGYEFDPNSMKKTDVTLYHGGWPQDEIAALVSLSLGIRVQAGSSSRRFEPDKDPRGSPEAFFAHENTMLLKPSGRSPVLPRMLGDHSLNSGNLLLRLAEQSPAAARALVRAARLYQDAAWISESEPELAWIMFVSSIETAAGFWRANSRLATKKFLDFIQYFLPEPPPDRPAEVFQHSWNPNDIEKSMKVIYEWRSQALHHGIPFPEPMCLAPMKLESGYDEKPAGLSAMAKGGVWVAQDMPVLLHTFEYIVRGCLLKWWASMLPAKAAA